MNIKTGVDLVYIPEFEQLFNKNLLSKVFNKGELRNSKAEHAAGIFAAKEAVMKALNLKPGSWDTIYISHEKLGRPVVKVKTELNIKNIDISISHVKDYAVASCVVLMT